MRIGVLAGAFCIFSSLTTIQGAGIVMVKKNVLTEDAFATLTTYSSVLDDPRSPLLQFTFGPTKRNFKRSLVADYLEIRPFPQRIEQLNEIEIIKKTLVEFKGFTERFPQSREILQPYISSYSGAVSKFTSGQRFINDEWLTEIEWKRINTKEVASNNFSKPESDLDELDWEELRLTSGKIFRGVRIVRQSRNSITISHSSGITTIPIETLPPGLDFQRTEFRKIEYYPPSDSKYSITATTDLTNNWKKEWGAILRERGNVKLGDFFYLKQSQKPKRVKGNTYTLLVEAKAELKSKALLVGPAESISKSKGDLFIKNRSMTTDKGTAYLDAIGQIKYHYTPYYRDSRYRFKNSNFVQEQYLSISNGIFTIPDTTQSFRKYFESLNATDPLSHGIYVFYQLGNVEILRANYDGKPGSVLFSIGNSQYSIAADLIGVGVAFGDYRRASKGFGRKVDELTSINPQQRDGINYTVAAWLDLSESSEGKE